MECHTNIFHFGDRSSRDMNEEQELEQAAGESVTQPSLAAESKEEPRLLLLSRSDERLWGKKTKSDKSKRGHFIYRNVL